MVQYIITPWRSQADLLRVRHQLYPDPKRPSNLQGRKDAVARVMVWVQRGNCPHLVESTAILTSAILNDIPGNSTYCVRAAYAAAFCRFVTGLLDSHQDKRRKLSMYSIAKSLGLPATYVELRHQATHEELPSLSKLRSATQKALRWIWDYYWVRLPSAPQEELVGKGKANEKEDQNVSEAAVADLDCRSFVEKLLNEPDASKRTTLESGLSKWDQGEVLDTVMQIQNATTDIGIVLRATQLQQQLMAAEESDAEGEPTGAGMEWQQGQEHSPRMSGQLASGEGVGAEEDATTGSSAASNSVKGWTLWAGPWVSKPIGVV